MTVLGDGLYQALVIDNKVGGVVADLTPYILRRPVAAGIVPSTSSPTEK